MGSGNGMWKGGEHGRRDRDVWEWNLERNGVCEFEVGLIGGNKPYLRDPPFNLLSKGDGKTNFLF
jgi:hypothetical protein